jgi:hypothetical protein
MSLPLDRNVPAEGPEKQSVYSPAAKTLCLAEFERGFRAGGFFHHHRFSERVLTNVFCSPILDFRSQENIPGPMKRVSDYQSPAIQADRPTYRG